MTTNPYTAPESGRAKPPSTNIGLRRAVAIFVIVIAGPFAAAIAFGTTCAVVPRAGALMILSFVLSSLAAGAAYSLAIYFTLPKRRIVAPENSSTDAAPLPYSASSHQAPTESQSPYRTAVMLTAPIVAIFLTCLASIFVPIFIDLTLPIFIDLILTRPSDEDRYSIIFLGALATVAVGLIATIVVTLRFYKWYERS